MHNTPTDRRLPHLTAIALGLAGNVIVSGISVWFVLFDAGVPWGARPAIFFSVLLFCTAVYVLSLWNRHTERTPTSLWLMAATVVVTTAFALLTLLGIGLLLLPGVVLMGLATLMLARW